MLIKMTRLSMLLCLQSIVCLLLFSSSPAVSLAQSTSVRHEVNDDSNNWIWNHSEDGLHIKVQINGKVEFNDDYTEILSISNGGSISVLEDRNGVTRKFEASPSPGGSLKRAYFVQGESRPFDTDARSWLSRMLLDTVRQSGYDAKPRVQRLLKQRGVNGVLEEISQIRSDYGKRIYFQELLSSAELNAGIAQKIIQQATREVHSDYEKAQILTKIGDHFLSDEAIRAAYLEGVNSLSSDYEKGRVLQSLLKQNNLSRETRAQIIKAAGHISSDYEKTKVLMSIASLSPNDEATSQALLEASKTIHSDYEKARLLLKALEVSGKNEASRDAYLEGVRTLSSDYEKGQVLQALLKQEGLSKETLKRIINLTGSISSNYEKANLLVKIATAGSGDESIRNAIVEASKSISSEYDRGRVLNAVFK